MLFDAAAVFVLPQGNKDNERYLFLDTSRTACAKRTGAAASVGRELAKAISPGRLACGSASSVSAYAHSAFVYVVGARFEIDIAPRVSPGLYIEVF